MESRGFVADIFDLSFTHFITTKWIKLIFIIALAIFAIALAAAEILGLITLFTGDGAGGKFMGLVIMAGAGIYFLLAVIGLRIYMELVVVMFRIEENTRACRPDGGPSEATRGFPVTPVAPQ